MSPHATWFEFLPGYRSLYEGLHGPLGRTWTWQIVPDDALPARPRHGRAARVPLPAVRRQPLRRGRQRRQRRRPGAAAQVRHCATSSRTLADMIFDLMASVMGEKKPALPAAPRHVVLLHPVLEPALAHAGLPPPTDTLKTNLISSVMVFLLDPRLRREVARNQVLQALHGHPLGGSLPLMIPIEIVSHLARPVSLSMRLLGNIVADHAVVLAFFALIPFLVPVPLPAHGGVRLGRPGDRLLVALHRLHQSGSRSRRALARESNYS